MRVSGVRGAVRAVQPPAGRGQEREIRVQGVRSVQVAAAGRFEFETSQVDADVYKGFCSKRRLLVKFVIQCDFLAPRILRV